MMLGEFRSARLAATFAFSRWASGKDGTGPELSAAAATCAKSWPDPAKSRADFAGSNWADRKGVSVSRRVASRKYSAGWLASDMRRSQGDRESVVWGKSGSVSVHSVGRRH